MIQSQSDDNEIRLTVVFFRTQRGSEPVREWLKSLQTDEKRILGEDIKTAQFGWPLGMPLIRKLEPGLWEVRSNLPAGIARIIFTVEDHTMVLLHGLSKNRKRLRWTICNLRVIV